MLALSERAVVAINGIMSNPEIPEGAGLRVSPQMTGGTEAVTLELSVVEAPAGGDQVVEDQGAQVFVDERVGQGRGEPVSSGNHPSVDSAAPGSLRSGSGACPSGAGRRSRP